MELADVLISAAITSVSGRRDAVALAGAEDVPRLGLVLDAVAEDVADALRALAAEVERHKDRLAAGGLVELLEERVHLAASLMSLGYEPEQAHQVSRWFLGRLLAEAADKIAAAARG